MIVGLTGGIGSGKSTVAHILQILGYPVYNSDVQAKVISNSNISLVEKIKALFGPTIYKDGELNRKMLAQIVFQDKLKLSSLNELIHPAVAEDFIQWQETQETELIFKEAAILFESGAYKKVDKIITLSAPKTLRLSRVMHRDKMSEDEVRRRMANQWSEEQRCAHADYIIYADDKQLLIPQVLDILNHLVKE